VNVTQINTASEMHDAVMRALPSHDIVVGAAAVADFAPEQIASSKIKKESNGDGLTIALKKNPDILSDIASSSTRPFVVAFAAETDRVEENAREKLARKDADLIVANDVSDSSIGFDSDQNEVIVIGRDGSSTHIDRASKTIVANRILDVVVATIRSRTPAVPYP
jgi:phosphopantothenoylcysteine decarboxylase/phosphopantothenate--cysteine ligase